MDDHYGYQNYHLYPGQDHLPIMHEVPYYHHPNANTLAASIPGTMMDHVSIAPNAALKEAHLSSFNNSMQYPLPPSPADRYWASSSPFDESVRSISPQTDCQSSGCMPALIYDDPISGFESSPSPSSYPEPMSPPTQISQPMPHQSTSTFLPGYITNQPSDYTTSPTSYPSSEPSEAPRKATSTRKANPRSRVQKRNSKSNPQKIPARSNRAEAATVAKQPAKKTTERRFQCCFARYGCTSTFPSKNEWKRHVSSQHIQSGFYRCDVGRCSLNNNKHRSISPQDQPQSSPSPPYSESGQPTTPTLLLNDFNRKDLFIQHQRRMHAPWVTTTKSHKQSPSKVEKEAFEASLDSVVKRCWQQLRAPPMLSCCGFCSMEFRGANAWKERMEHVARHLEKADPGPEKEDIPLRVWADENGIIRFVGGGWKLTALCGK
ncbi:hypothetical protein BJX76DRAFT_366081 [Aspergillus varians]